MASRAKGVTRARKRHRQTSLPMAGLKPGYSKYGRKLGRPRKALRGALHEKRPVITRREPVQVTMRVVEAVGQLRRRSLYKALRAATLTAARREDLRIVHVSIQHNHVHLLVEADSTVALSRGMQGFQISAAKLINAALPKVDGRRRRGKVFADRYHVTVIRTPTQARRELAYVLNNWRKHGEHRRPEARGWRVDPFSTGVLFDGWTSGVQPWIWPPTYEPLVVAPPRSWLLSVGWRRLGAIRTNEVPSAAEKRARIERARAEQLRAMARLQG